MTATATEPGARVWGRELSPEQLVWLTAGATLLFKMLLAVLVPLTKDEGYFVMWGATPSLGYSEHPPMIGLVEHLLLYLGRTPLIVRMPAILGTVTIGLGLFWLMKDLDRNRAALASVLFLLSPINLIYVIVTTDSTLIVFSFWSAFCLFQALRSDRYGWFAAAGVLLGLAFLSKYFAVLLALAYFAYYLASKKHGRKTRGMLLLFACVIPFGLVSLYWNYTHSWMEVRYPFYRSDNAQFSLFRPLSYVAIQLYLLLPAGFYCLVRHRGRLLGKVADSPIRLFGFLFIVPLSVLGLLSLRKVIGLHWVLSFYPFVYLLAGYVLGEIELRKSIRFTAFYSGAHVALILALLAIPLPWLVEYEGYSTWILGWRPREIVAALEPYAADHRFATPGYSVSGLLELYYPGKHFAVFGRGTHHGRNDDFVTDFREWDGEDVMVFQRDVPDLEFFEPFFTSVTTRSLDIEGARYYLVFGREFDFEAYRDKILVRIRDRYYRIPEWMPGNRYFREKYFE